MTPRGRRRSDGLLLWAGRPAAGSLSEPGAASRRPRVSFNGRPCRAARASRISRSMIGGGRGEVAEL
eukprot:755490-Hanusia_phi.AAC.7